MNRIICWPICIPNARNSEGSTGDIHVFILSCDLKSIQLALLGTIRRRNIYSHSRFITAKLKIWLKITEKLEIESNLLAVRGGSDENVEQYSLPSQSCLFDFD